MQGGLLPHHHTRQCTPCTAALEAALSQSRATITVFRGLSGSWRRTQRVPEAAHRLPESSAPDRCEINTRVACRPTTAPAKHRLQARHGLTRRRCPTPLPAVLLLIP